MLPDQYQALRQRIDRFESAKKTVYGDKKCSFTERELAVLGLPQPTNEERSQVEVYEFQNNPPDAYFVYIKEDRKIATTWMGDFLGNVTFGRPYKVFGFGGVRTWRQSVTIDAINGHRYYGTYYQSSGDYARIKRCKNT